MACTLGLDVGTSGVKAVIWDSVLGEVAVGQSRYPLETWIDKDAVAAEQNPDLWLRAISEAVSELPIGLRSLVVAVGVTGHMHAFIALDKDGSNLGPAMLWFDHRASNIAEELETKYPNLWRLSIGGPLLADYPAAKWIWLQRHDPSAVAQIKFLVQAKDWIKWKLSGVLATDPGEASGTGYFNIFKGEWDYEILERLSLSPAILPIIAPANSIVGEVTRFYSSILKIPLHTPLVNGTGDLLATASMYPLNVDSSILFNLGTAAQVVAMSDGKDGHEDIAIFKHADNEHVIVAMPLLAAGMTLQWWNNITKCQFNNTSLDPGRPLFLPQIAGERDANGAHSGAFLGLTVYNDSAELSRAVLTGIVLSLQEGRDDLVNRIHVDPTNYYISGGKQLIRLIGPRLASATGDVIYGLAIEEPAACGAANIALKATGAYDDCIIAQAQMSFEPSEDWHSAYADRYQLYCNARAFYRKFSKSLSDL